MTAPPTRITAYAGLLRWVELTLPGAASPEVLLAVQVLGAAKTEPEPAEQEPETATQPESATGTEAAAETETAMATTAAETDPETATAPETERGTGPDQVADADALALESGEDLLAEMFDEPGVAPGAPPLTHVALYRPDGGFVAHVGGTERPIGYVAGVVRDAAGAEELLLVSQSRVHGCSLGFWNPATEALRWVPLARCISFPALATGRLFAEAALASPAPHAELPADAGSESPDAGPEASAARDADPSPDDAEIVEVDLATGAVTALTRNAVRERYVRARALPGGGVRLAFERIPRRRFRRFPQSSVCWADLPPAAP